ncbi:hypothetical protein [Rhodanobacter sp. MP7CTX1]|uniref:hypothetical protein n=1 Tax=Rhodanobacter sp. MP7CTX1 TaxID=2723084 RepID=UPI00160B7182|nr:hypothetical protein [Rhodanobacter sp. MP7CTX1]MBB6187698.1 hypothetical protein [Rhodanobacter sp. MP7CTX1]
MNKFLKTIVVNEVGAALAAAAMSASLIAIYNVPDQARYFFYLWLSILQLFVLANLVKFIRAGKK